MTAAPDEGGDFVRLLDYLKVSRGFDFSGYKISSLIRRVQKRMQQVGVSEYGAYLDYLEVHPDEFAPLFNTVLINVTAFFRDAPAWQGLAEQVLPRILEEKPPDEPIRCWSAGCASGEEAYSVAMLLAEALGEHEYRRRVKIYATDADEEALSTARQGSYPEACAKDVPPELLARYFEKSNDRYVFRPDLRRSLIFGRHDLVQDAAISRIDLLICRNTLMYFNAETQARILARFHFALHRNGYLFLGRAENYRECVLYIEDDGRFVDAASGETLAPQAVIPAWRRSCMTRGATVAANRRAKMQALEDVKTFLKTTLYQ